MADDQFQESGVSLVSPYQDAKPITVDTELEHVTRGIFVGDGGDVKAVLASGREVTFNGMATGADYPIRVQQIKSSGTTASNLLALY